MRILREPTGCQIASKGKSREATREIYKTVSGGWAITYRGGDLSEEVLREAIAKGVVADCYVGKGLHPNVGYDLVERLAH